MPDEYAIRHAQRADLDLLVGFTLLEALEAEHLELVETDVRRGVEGAFATPPRSRYWIAEHFREPVAHISVITEWSNFRGGMYWWVQSLFIKPEHRGRGLLEQMLDCVAVAARAEGALDLRLYAHRLNERALAAYRRYGFTSAPYVMMVDGL